MISGLIHKYYFMRKIILKDGVRNELKKKKNDNNTLTTDIVTNLISQ